MAGISEEKVSPGVVRRLYDVCMEWISGKYGVWALFFIAFIESSFFPLPPDIFLIALCIALPALSFRYAAICSVGSVLGGALGYGLGYWFMDGIGMSIIDWYGLGNKYQMVQQYFKEYDVWIVGTAGFTPIPYKLFTITAGFVHSNFVTFMIVSLVARSARFFLVAGLIWKFGPRIKTFIDRYFNILSIAFVVLLIGGFLLIKLVLAD
ncbi:YqaA family protein [Desulforhopalus sp. IMCC35007]|uniref:YqaA family protein n=1 Tax=Desulforhopalus sp. IMCC35007 TaxID=2569543 RepID=UPI001F112C6B|nr:VTT domain-containing protein [Desulforhopalus sp. IMCC35007]